MPVTVAHREYGRHDAPAIILSSSLGTTSEMWEPQAGLLSSRFRVIAYDHRGHGSSPLPDGPYTLGDLADDVVSLMDRLSIPRAHFAGISLGGMIGMWLGAHAPDRIDHLALLCTFARVESPAMWHERAAKVRASGTEPIADASLERWFTPSFRESRPDVTARFRSMVSSIPAEGYAGCCEAIAGMQITGDLDTIEAPTLVIAGSQDIGATPEIGRRLADSLPSAIYREVPAAHLANVEQPEAVSTLIMEHMT